MNLLKLKTTWSTLELGTVKASTLSAGILIGCYLHLLLNEYLTFFWVAFSISTVWGVSLWINKIKK